METIGRIRREHFLKGKTIKEIAKDLGVPEHSPQGPAIGSDAIGDERRRVPDAKSLFAKRSSWVSEAEIDSFKSAREGLSCCGTAHQSARSEQASA